MNIVLDTFSLTNDAVESIDFYHDFLAFLCRLRSHPIKRTLTGNISLKDIESLLKELRTTRERINEYKKYGWTLRSEQELQTLEQIKILAEVMRLTYKRKGKLFLSKNGQEFLNKLTPIEQYHQMILYYWNRVNWDYFSAMRNAKGVSLNEVLQDNQDEIWHYLLSKDSQWINYEKFCLALRDYFHLESFLLDPVFDPDKQLYSDIDFVFFKKNLLLFNCVEIQENRFRSTQVGLSLYQKTLYENYL